MAKKKKNREEHIGMNFGLSSFSSNLCLSTNKKSHPRNILLLGSFYSEKFSIKTRLPKLHILAKKTWGLN